MLDSTSNGSATRAAWASEARATLVLAAPIVLTNVAQLALGTTDIIMMGWLGPKALAAGALAVNLNWALLVFAIGVVTATAPMVAHELGRNRHSVREVRRAVRQGLWTAVVLAIPLWGILWQAEPILRASGEPEVIRAAD